ncbi:MAG: 50S ribosomal protein L11 methyltransferase [Rhizobiales bacterium]|nr:50S ribosomal protein L11 methyltransferase [Hyphomicrobiales bacterium]MBO6697659.1 50S ribosomal protein L11 methyltransferase [Hyphomicrobiales bacterium]MBO6736086.1 50S ribosomal protein L11 methyltransferase [Hyphomicrobiales bacterium]MBO6912556.1 50S ribosomal protein L11 methyltransferase [Hyphomicrobiales bacterium]
MPTVKATLTVPHREEAERIADLLGLAFESDETPIAFFEDEEAGHWTVDAFQEGDDAPALASAIRDALGSDAFAAPLDCHVLDEVDWVTASLEGLQAIRAGRFVVHGLHARDAVGPTDIGIRVEASRAFGTGHHGTTLGCLELIDWACARQRYCNILDVGTGTGVLAMAAVHLTKAPVLATDIDPISVEVTRQNAKLNQLDPWITVAEADGVLGAPQTRAPYDLIMANILAGPLIDLAAPMTKLLASGGGIILSGLMQHQERAVRARYRAEGLVLVKRIHHGEWSALFLQRL